MERKCDNCGKTYKADKRNIRRGWGLCCSKSCAASKREKRKPGYDPKRVEENNYRRATWNRYSEDGRYKGRTAEGYEIYGNTAYDEFGERMYDISYL